MFHTRLFAVIALALAMSPVFGADLPVNKAYSPMAAPGGWAGFYLGVDAGYTFDAPFKFSDNRDVFKVDPRGGTFGGHAGHNWQSGPFVYGVELFAAWNGNSATEQVDKFATLNAKVDYFGSATARLGLTLGNDLLLYGRGGIGFAHTAATIRETTPVSLLVLAPTATVTDTSSAFAVHYGPVVGAGIEWRMFGSSSWLLRVDYQHYALGKTSYAFGGDIQANIPASVNLDVVTAGLSYKFGP